MFLFNWTAGTFHRLVSPPGALPHFGGCVPIRQGVFGHFPLSRASRPPPKPVPAFIDFLPTSQPLLLAEIESNVFFCRPLSLKPAAWLARPLSTPSGLSGFRAESLARPPDCALFLQSRRPIDPCGIAPIVLTFSFASSPPGCSTAVSFPACRHFEGSLLWTAVIRLC